jgi:hypothetical protein
VLESWGKANRTLSSAIEIEKQVNQALCLLGLSTFRPWPAVNHPVGERRLGKLSGPQDVYSDNSVLSGSKPPEAGRQLPEARQFTSMGSEPFPL